MRPPRRKPSLTMLRIQHCVLAHDLAFGLEYLLYLYTVCLYCKLFDNCNLCTIQVSSRRPSFASDNCGVLEGEEYADLQRVLSVKEVPQPEMHHAARSKARFGGRPPWKKWNAASIRQQDCKAPSWASARLL